MFEIFSGNVETFFISRYFASFTDDNNCELSIILIILIYIIIYYRYILAKRRFKILNNRLITCNSQPVFHEHILILFLLQNKTNRRSTPKQSSQITQNKASNAISQSKISPKEMSKVREFLYFFTVNILMLKNPFLTLLRLKLIRMKTIGYWTGISATEKLSSKLLNILTYLVTFPHIFTKY